MAEHSELSGFIDRFLYQNQENGYTVFVLKTSNDDAITVTGNLAALVAGQQINVTGSWAFHPKFGKQFEAVSCSTTAPSTIDGLKKYLGSGLIKGIGPVYAEKMVKLFGHAVLDVIDQTPERLREVEGIGPVRIEKIITAWKDQKEISTIMVFLQDKGISPAYATKIYKRYGQQSIAVVKENPYRLADEIWGIGFKTADLIARNLGYQVDSLNRIKAGIAYVISDTLKNGHLYIEIELLKKNTFELLNLETQEHGHHMKQALHALYDAGKLVVLSPPTDPPEHFVTLAQYYYTEKSIAQKIKQLVQQTTKRINIDEVYAKLRASNSEKFELNEDQQRGILSCLQHNISIITGGPGTGKTTLIKSLLDILDSHHFAYQLAAPTGRAAKRIMQGTGRYALTIHRLLEFDVGSMSFTHNERNALKLDFLIIDEASMIDVFLAHAILKAVPHNAHLIFIGDVDQLPSVGAGNFLHDLIASNTVPVVRLTRIFRQAHDSLIVVNAHRVNAGQFPMSYLPDTQRDFIYIKEDAPENVVTHLSTIYQQTLKRYGIPAAESIVLSPMHRGIVGTQALNHQLQSILNPHQTASIEHTGTVYKVGDKVMQLKNNYDKGVFNGDIGTLHAISVEDKLITVAYDDREIEYEYEELNELVLAYAISIHKSQGSEYKAVIIPLFTSHFTLLQRNVLYTAITRAKKLCILIGQTKAIAMAIKNNKGTERKTFLTEFLTGNLQCR